MSVVIVDTEGIPEKASKTVAQLLEEQGLEAAFVMVRVNGEVVRREEYSTCKVCRGALVKAYPFVGGG
ncbi:sulfur carrier protein ThiS [Desulfuromonas sp. CSMB_57]|uniref:sulfur carrier protein ThiS n=1 Tax=Desulfuromonas sp. CSMB_57 TaxID=2807629 RepID=UPI001CD3CA33|nr:sulfur carrier protein ThiS [Desulfuromonas sp. CSMB_57]